MALCHLCWTSTWACCFIFINLLHLSTQIRWLTSEISICRSLVFPFLLAFLLWSVLFALRFPSCTLRLPTPSMVPIEISSHVCCPCGHALLACSQIALLGLVWHLSSIWLMDSVLLQKVHFSLSWKPCIPFCTSPIMYVLCIVLKRNCCTLCLNTVFFRSSHTIPSVS